MPTLDAIRAACAVLRNSPAICDCRDYGPGGQRPCRSAVRAVLEPQPEKELRNAD
jgi:hypothetical protein